MGRLQDRAGQVREFVVAQGLGLGRRAAILATPVADQVRRIVDHDKWSIASNWRERVAAVSWPRAAAITVLSTTLAVSLWMIIQPDGMRSHPPRLPTEEEWRANQAAAEAMEGDLSPALAAANRTEPSGAEP